MSKWTESMKQLLDDMKSRGDTRENLDADAALQFIERTNTALIQYIGMYSDQQYQLEKASLKMYTEQTIDLLLLYLKA